MNKYKVTISNSVIEFENEQEASDFAVDNNTSYESFEEIEETEPPRAVTPRQMRVALIMSGVSIASIESMIDALEEPQKSIVRTTWEYSTAFERENPILNSMADGLGLTQIDVDNLFILADTL